MPRDAAWKALKGRRAVYVPEALGYASCAVYDRYALAPGAEISGPALVEEPESTVYIGAAAKGTVTRSGDLRVKLPQPGEARRPSRRKAVEA
jgi:N-methylhydantoinase A